MVYSFNKFTIICTLHNQILDKCFAWKGCHYIASIMPCSWPITILLSALGTLNHNFVFRFLACILVIWLSFVASKATKDNVLHIYNFVGDNGDEDGELRLVGKFVFQFDEIAKEVYVIEDEVLWRVWLGNLRKYQSLWFPFQNSVAIWFLLSIHLVKKLMWELFMSCGVLCAIPHKLGDKKNMLVCDYKWEVCVGMKEVFLKEAQTSQNLE